LSVLLRFTFFITPLAYSKLCAYIYIYIFIHVSSYCSLYLIDKNVIIRQLTFFKVALACVMLLCKCFPCINLSSYIRNNVVSIPKTRQEQILH
jgi:hypothetical protein